MWYHKQLHKYFNFTWLVAGKATLNYTISFNFRTIIHFSMIFTPQKMPCFKTSSSNRRDKAISYIKIPWRQGRVSKMSKKIVFHHLVAKRNGNTRWIFEYTKPSEFIEYKVNILRNVYRRFGNKVTKKIPRLLHQFWYRNTKHKRKYYQFTNKRSLFGLITSFPRGQFHTQAFHTQRKRATVFLSKNSKKKSSKRGIRQPNKKHL